MSVAPRLYVKDWERFQHYGNRTPPWIKLYNDLLENYEFAQLPDASKAHLVSIWLLASRMSNSIPADSEFIAKKIGATEPVDLCVLINAGFLRVYGDASVVGSNDAIHARPEKEEEREKEVHSVHDEWPVKPRQVNGQYEYPERFEIAWAAYPKRDGSNPKVGAYKAFRSRVTSGADPNDLTLSAEHYALHCRHREVEGTAYVQQASTFFGPSEPWREFVDPPNLNGNGSRPRNGPQIPRVRYDA